MLILQFWSHGGIQIFNLDLVLNLLIDRHLIFSFSQKFIRNCNGNTDCKSGRGDFVNFFSLVCLSGTTCRGLLQLVCKVSKACGSFQSSCGVNIPTPSQVGL